MAEETNVGKVGAAGAHRFAYVTLGGVYAAGRWPVHVPEGPLLTVQNLPLHLVPLLVHLDLRLRLHIDELPLLAQQLLQLGQILGLVVRQLQARLILHGALAQVDGVFGVLRLGVIRRPVVRRLEAKEGAVVLDRQYVVVDGKEIAVRAHQVREMQRLARVLYVDPLYDPLYQVGAREHARYFGHEALDGLDRHARHLVLHALHERLHLLVEQAIGRLVNAHLLMHDAAAVQVAAAAAEQGGRRANLAGRGDRWRRAQRRVIGRGAAVQRRLRDYLLACGC